MLHDISMFRLEYFQEYMMLQIVLTCVCDSAPEEWMQMLVKIVRSLPYIPLNDFTFNDLTQWQC